MHPHGHANARLRRHPGQGVAGPPCNPDRLGQQRRQLEASRRPDLELNDACGNGTACGPEDSQASLGSPLSAHRGRDWAGTNPSYRRLRGGLLSHPHRPGTCSQRERSLYHGGACHQQQSCHGCTAGRVRGRLRTSTSWSPGAQSSASHQPGARAQAPCQTYQAHVASRAPGGAEAAEGLPGEGLHTALQQPLWVTHPLRPQEDRRAAHVRGLPGPERPDHQGPLPSTTHRGDPGPSTWSQSLHQVRLGLWLPSIWRGA